MEKDLTYFEGLIAKYFSGEATSSEIAELSSWVALDPVNEKIFSESREAWMAVEEVRVTESADVDLEWKKIDVQCTMYNVQMTSDKLRVTGYRDERDDRFARDDRDEGSLSFTRDERDGVMKGGVSVSERYSSSLNENGRTVVSR